MLHQNFGPVYDSTGRLMASVAPIDPPLGMHEGQTLEDALFWAEHHAASDIAEHNKKWFAGEAVRIRAAIAAR